MNSYEAYTLYLAIKLHFTSNTYDFYKHNAKVNSSFNTFLKRNDRFFFHKLTTKYNKEEMLEYFVSNFFHNSKTWIGNLVRADGETIYNKWTKYNQSFTYNFRGDCVLLSNTINDSGIRFDDLFHVANGQHPKLLRLFLSEKISVQTLIILDKVLSFIKKWDKEIGENVIWPEKSFKIKKQKGANSGQWIKRIGMFLDRQQWRDHAITFLLPAEDVTFRKITFPFKERKKVEQALPFELEEELMGSLADSTYSVDVHLMSEQNSEALVLLMEREQLEQLKQLCMKRDLLIQNIDCAAYALFRSKIHDNSNLLEPRDLFQIYLGGDETFVNTVREGRLDEIKIFPNTIPEILRKHFSNTEKTLPSFLQTFAKDPDTSNNAESKNDEAEVFRQIKEELRWLCSQLTMHLRIKNFTSESQIEVYGIFGPSIKWDGVIFRIRSFPLPEVEAFTERSGERLHFLANSDIELADEIKVSSKLETKVPNTLEELMIEAKQRKESDEKIQNYTTETDPNYANEKAREKHNKENISVSELDSINLKESLLSLTDRKHWGMLGELRKKVDILLEPHKLSLYHESTPWRHFLLRNRFTVSVTVSLMIILTASYVVQKNTRLNLLQEDITRTERLIKTELSRVLPKNSATGINKMMIELQENIKNRKEYIETSNKFEKREYFNLIFLQKISVLLDEDAPFQVDNLEFAPDRFSISGTIDSYDMLQVLKNNLQDIEEFKSRKIIESNRKSPEGIVYKITIEIK